MSVLAPIEAKLKELWEDIDGDAKAELKQLLADAKADEAKFAPLLTAFEADLKSAVAGALPEIKTAVEALVAKLIADAGGILGSAA